MDNTDMHGEAGMKLFDCQDVKLLSGVVYARTYSSWCWLAQSFCFVGHTHVQTYHMSRIDTVGTQRYAPSTVLFCFVLFVESQLSELQHRRCFRIVLLNGPVHMLVTVTKIPQMFACVSLRTSSKSYVIANLCC